MLYMEEKSLKPHQVIRSLYLCNGHIPKDQKCVGCILRKKIVIDENAAQIVRRIFAMALSGVSCPKDKIIDGTDDKVL